jgi:hypothetical protein
MLKSSLALIALAAPAFITTSWANGPAPLPSAHPAYGVKVGSTIVAVIPVGSSPIDVTSNSISYDQKTGNIIVSGDAKLLLKVAGEAPVTLSGEKFTLVPQK